MNFPDALHNRKEFHIAKLYAKNPPKSQIVEPVENDEKNNSGDGGVLLFQAVIRQAWLDAFGPINRMIQIKKTKKMTPYHVQLNAGKLRIRRDEIVQDECRHYLTSNKNKDRELICSLANMENDFIRDRAIELHNSTKELIELERGTYVLSGPTEKELQEWLLQKK